MLYNSKLIERLRNFQKDTPILVKKNQSIFAEAVFNSSVALARNLYAQGMRKDDRVVIAAEPGVDFLRIIYATMLLRAKIAIIDPEMGRDNYEAKLAQFDPTWAFVDSRLLLLQEHPILRWFYLKLSKTGPYFPRRKGLNIISTGSWMPLLQKQTRLASLLKDDGKPAIIQPSEEDHEYIVTYTSGTMSEPKGVLHTFFTLEKSFEHIIRLLGNPKGQRIAAHLPHFKLIGITAGIPVFIWNYKSSAEEKIDFLEKNNITTLFGPPSDFLELMAGCDRLGRKLPDCLQHVLLGSAPVFVAFLEKLTDYLSPETKITALYGMTENLVVAHIDGREKMTYSAEGDPLGKPVEGIEIKIAEDNEILLKSDQLHRRYWHLNEHSEWHATGDLGKLDGSGTLIMTGRKKDMIIRRNQNIYPGLYEPTIHKIKDVVAAAMIGIYDDEKHDEVVYLAVESINGLTENQLKRQLEFGDFSIDREALPDKIVFMKIPRKGRQNKIDRKAIRARLAGLKT